MKLNELAYLSQMMLLVGTNYYTNKLSPHTKTKPKDLPKWKVGEHIIFAKDANTAKKYAKRRGLWKEGYTIEKI